MRPAPRRADIEGRPNQRRASESAAAAALRRRGELIFQSALQQPGKDLNSRRRRARRNLRRDSRRRRSNLSAVGSHAEFRAPTRTIITTTTTTTTAGAGSVQRASRDSATWNSCLGPRARALACSRRRGANTRANKRSRTRRCELGARRRRRRRDIWNGDDERWRENTPAPVERAVGTSSGRLS